MNSGNSESGNGTGLVLPALYESLDLLMNSPVGTFTSTPDGKLLYCNESLARLFGYDSPRAMVRCVIDIGSQLYTDSNYRDKFRSLMQTDGRVKNLECPMKRQNGTVFWASLNAHAIKSENGENIFYQGYVSDVSSRRQAEEKFTKIFMAAPNCIAIIRIEDGVIVDVNSGFEEITGWDSSDAIGRNSADVGLWLSPEDRKTMMAILLEGKDFINWEFEFRNRNGNLRNGIYSARSIVIENEPHYILILQDVTQKKLSDESLRLTQFAMDRAPDSILWVDDNGYIIYANQAACSSMGFSREELLEKKVFEIDPDFPEDGWEQHKTDMRRLGRMSFEGRHRKKNGDMFPVEVTTNYIDYMGKFLGIAFDRDISERKKAEEERERLQNRLFHAQKMESLGTLAGGVAHDFNNLLQIVSGNVEMLKKGKDGTHPDFTRLEAISKSIRRAGALTQQLLLFGRKAVVQRKPLDLNNQVREALNILGRTVPKMIKIRSILVSDPWFVGADPIQVEQVMLNLVSNSVYAMPDGGEFTVETKNISIDGDDPGNFMEIPSGRYVLLKVTDTGFGMSGETLNHVFDPFFTTKEVGEGTGLGLASVYGIVKAHGGYINCQSKLGKGTTFRIYWPVLDKPLSQPTTPPNKQPSGGTESILVVDDEPEILELTREFLEPLGYRVFTVNSGEQALNALMRRKDELSMVLLDLNMPGMGGMKCLKRIMKDYALVKVLVASGYIEDRHTQEALEAGASGFISKPYHMNELAARIRDILDESRL